MKTCNNCIHQTAYACCYAAVDKVDLISGLIFGRAQELKYMRSCEAYCGAEGKWYEEKFKP